MRFSACRWSLAAFVLLATSSAFPDTRDTIAGGVHLEASEYRGGNTHVNPFPYFQYGRWFLHGIEAGANVWQNDAQVLALSIARVGAGFNSTDSGFDGMRTLKHRNFANLLWRHEERGEGWDIRVEGGVDVSGRSDGTRAETSLGYGWRVASAIVTPYIGGEWLDGRETRYRYAVYADEASATRPAYEPGSALNPYIGLNMLLFLSRHQGLHASLEARRLDDAVYSSPLVDAHWKNTATLLYCYWY